ncbi:class I SAM-dependent RNA methyltransferase [Demequina sp. NBRC 110055]|uniref:class I SAM-dependent RNA methyltransferase n=1 Tax=Demequina sp. NBRC 110055 TaxID=1570344 RepID=UPI001F436ADD|nr:TRAM domain-containing protein [Demequina sp. NBRC 110055]
MTTLDLTVGAPAHGGHCVARHEGRVVFVRHALPGERVRARLTESGADAKLWRADAVEILEASDDRVDSPWPEAGPGGIGGAELGHVALAAQREWKLAVLRESFKRFAGRPFEGAVRALDGDDEAGGLHYRTRVSASADAEGKAAMHAHRGDTLHALTAMPLAVPDVEHALLSHRFPAGARVSVAQGTDGTVRIVVDGTPWKAGKKDTRPHAPRTLRESVTVAGHTYDFKVDADGFWQVHRGAPATLVGEVLARVGDAASVADLYAGAGLFSLPLAATGRAVTSVETDRGASRSARRNLHAYPQASIVQGDVRRTLESGIGRPDAAVIDPPRSGAGRRTLDALVATGTPRIVYVACDPVALARDTALLAERGYDLVDAQAFDLFPMTHHVETVATFTSR